MWWEWGFKKKELCLTPVRAGVEINRCKVQSGGWAYQKLDLEGTEEIKWCPGNWVKNLGLPTEPGMEVPYYNDQEHGQLLISLENEINDINSTACRGGNANQVSSSHEVHPVHHRRSFKCEVYRHYWTHKPYYPSPRNRVILDICQTLGTSPASDINRKEWQR